MVQIAQSHQYPLKKFLDVEQGAAALSALQDAGFSPDRLALVPEALNSTAKVSQTEAASNAGKGAIAGTVLGALAGFLLAALGQHDPASPAIASFPEILSFALLAGGVGAAAGALIASITGSSLKQQTVQSTEDSQGFLLVVDNTTQEEIQKAQEILQQMDAGAAI
ncbi:hypothetical protein [Leptolyngbya ohadii]|uniref:hypothetical protein n=1 Tax=Leptolyngbya ohadii TaxID=1962290 RepID=UPI000B5A108D|nr:hypothetical protein [Leptolyngbya ohadii]